MVAEYNRENYCTFKNILNSFQFSIFFIRSRCSNLLIIDKISGTLSSSMPKCCLVFSIIVLIEICLDIKSQIKEEELLTNKLEPTNEPYALAKIAGIKMCESYNRQYGKSHGIDYRCVMPSNLYGPGDNYHPENSHVIPGLIRKFHEAKMYNKSNVLLWGTGYQRRDFLYVDDLASACYRIMGLNKKTYQKK